jgi:hypothetical protein
LEVVIGGSHPLHDASIAPPSLVLVMMCSF